MRLAPLMCFAALSLPCVVGLARPVPLLSYDQLLQRADVVLIVRPVATRDAAEGDPIIGLEPSREDTLTPVVTSMRVLAVVKGACEEKSLLLPHYRMDWPKAKRNGIGAIANGPNLVTFAATAASGEALNFLDVPWDGDCLLFLVKRPGGGYDFVTGQIDPKFSVFHLGRETPERK